MSVCNVIHSKALDHIVEECDLFANPEKYPGLWQSTKCDSDYIIVSKKCFQGLYLPVRLSADKHYDMLWSSLDDCNNVNTRTFKYVGKIDQINIHVQ